MNKCLNCGRQIEVKDGRRPRQYCDNNGKCRNEYWRKNKEKAPPKWVFDYFKKHPEQLATTKTSIQDLTKPTNEIKPHEQQKTNYTIDTTLGEKEMTDKELKELAIRAKENAIQRIKELEEEIKHPPKNPTIGLSKWYAVRHNEIKILKEKYEQNNGL